MHMPDVRGLLPILLCMLHVSGVTRSSAIQSRPYNRVERSNNADSQKYNNVHNVTVDCGDYTGTRRMAMWQCQRYIYTLARDGYPWSPRGSQRSSRNGNDTLRDDLDSLNHACHIHDRSQTCLEKSGIPDYCLATNKDMYLQTDFHFICHHQQRDENLVHSLQCLHRTRVLPMLYFHIADRCQGFGILDDIMRRSKNAYFYTLNISPIFDRPITAPLYCLPKSVISDCIRDIVEDQCGTMTADFVQRYLVYLQDSFGQALQSAGVASNICEHDIHSDMVSSSPPFKTCPTKVGIFRLLEITAPGTALDTPFGKFVLECLNSHSGEPPPAMHIPPIKHVGCLQMMLLRTVSSISYSLHINN